MARAIENQCYVAGSNRLGTDGGGIKYCGDSVILNPRGEAIAAAGINEQCYITADVSIEELTDFRRKFPVFQDADDFTINTLF
jgi:predicted amidohydrolase